MLTLFFCKLKERGTKPVTQQKKQTMKFITIQEYSNGVKASPDASMYKIW